MVFQVYRKGSKQ